MSPRIRTRMWPWMVVVAIVAGGVAIWIRRDRTASATATPLSTRDAASAAAPNAIVSYEDARPVLDAFRDRLPADLKASTASELHTVWPEWARRHDADVRARLAKGDEDSIVNFWMYGTTFTMRPRATPLDLAALGGRAAAADVLLGRLDDLIAVFASPGSNERLQFARQLLDRRGIDPATDAGRAQARAYFIELHERVIADNDRYRQAAESAAHLAHEQARLDAFARVFSDRGLSSDTSIPIHYALDRTFDAAKAKGLVTSGVRRVAIIGPGLDFTDKADGYDFYPPQTIQPFAVIDSLVRLGLSTPADLHMTTFDLSPRVNGHLERARERAGRGESYVVQLPLTTNDPAHTWDLDLIEYWRRCGSSVGDVVASAAPPPGNAHVDIRAVAVRPAVVLAITPQDLNVVVERPAALTDADRFDLVIATNVLVYYDAFEQALALQNISRMLRPGGFFVTNFAVSASAPFESAASFSTRTYWDQQRNFDTLFWYRRQ